MKHLRNISFLKPFFKVRDCIMTKTGLFDVKRNIKQKMYFRKAKREDNSKRHKIAKEIMSMPDGWLTNNNVVDLTVSMTSYGKRVEKFVAYALYSILQQTLVPKRVVLNLDKTKWNDDNLPNIIKKLQKVGVQINYVHDNGPYTKLLPTLKKNPDDIIITVDDDIYYDNTLVEELYNAYLKSDKQSIICRNGARLLKEGTIYLPYMEQPHISTTDDAPGIPFGVSGVLYPPHVFDDEVFNSVVYKKICPSTDDIWFGIMALRNSIYVKYIHNNSWRGVVVDRNEEFNQIGSTAMHFSNDEKANTILKNLIDYYHL